MRRWQRARAKPLRIVLAGAAAIVLAMITAVAPP